MPIGMAYPIRQRCTGRAQFLFHTSHPLSAYGAQVLRLSGQAFMIHLACVEVTIESIEFS
eukprot:2123391-Pleurochrysis_carterae.AAC.1